ncbi:MAG: prepilin-type N-terminal cleavage/methylation domain-containing protein [Acidimicrobiia bacterium]
MIDKLRERRENEEGFTLIELMVVVLIIAILLAIAIPTFLGARDRANDRAAQSSLRNALTAAKVIFTDEQDYTQATASKLAEEEPSLTFQAGASTTFKQVSFATPTTTTFQAAALSKSGECFWIKDVAASVGGGTFYGGDPTGAACAGTDAAGAASGEW